MCACVEEEERMKRKSVEEDVNNNPARGEKRKKRTADEEDSLIANFISITSMSPEDARRYLEIFDWDVDRSLSDYFESTSANLEEEKTDVRAPIPSKRERLNDPTRRGPTSGSIDPFANFVSASPLAALYQKPRDILLAQPYEQARSVAKNSRKWLLVNIESLDFASSLLNRDVWSQQNIKQLVRENFIFIQVSNTSDDGKNLQRFHHIEELPFVGIFDPRTGEQLASWTNVVDPVRFHREMQEFLIVNSYDGSRPSLTDTNILDQDEDQQLARAIAESLAQSNTTILNALPSGEATRKQVEVVDLSRDDEENVPNEATTNTSASAKSLEHDTNGERIERLPNSVMDTVLQIRLPNGDVLKEDFSSTDTLLYVCQYIRDHCSKLNGNFTLMTTFPRKEYAGEDLKMSLATASLCPKAVLIVKSSTTT